jgi:hypothetical protein
MSRATVATIIVCVPIIMLLLAGLQLAPVAAPSWMGWPP